MKHFSDLLNKYSIWFMYCFCTACYKMTYRPVPVSAPGVGHRCLKTSLHSETPWWHFSSDCLFIQTSTSWTSGPWKMIFVCCCTPSPSSSPAEWTGWSRALRWTTFTSCWWPWSGSAKSTTSTPVSASASTTRCATWCAARIATGWRWRCKSPTCSPGQQIDRSWL